ncbi:site-specific integrase, partial [Burkholderia sp. SIMBA_048]|uniref:site-specific integrase n=1 Tax=Burkholderia sp. SIMBA_048 TaxID=3085789 RepID=UPI00397A2102
MRKAAAPKPPSFAALVQGFFTEYLVAQRSVSPRTVACYRDALTLFVDFASHKLAQRASRVSTPASGGSTSSTRI